MNKGLFAHIITTFLFCFMAIYVIGSDETTMEGRGWAIVLFLFSHFITAAICDYHNFYKQKV